MKLDEKIRLILSERGLTRVTLHKRIKTAFGKNAINYRSLRRIVNGDVAGKPTSLHQICIALGIRTKDLYSGVDERIEADVITRQNPEGRYVYNENAYAEIFSNRKVEYLLMSLVLKPGGETKLEKDPAGPQKFTKLVYILMGKLICVVGKEEILLKKGYSFSFDSRVPHYFKNHSKKRKAGCIIIQNPRRY